MIYDTPQYKAIEKFWREPDYYFGCAYGLPIKMLRNRSKAWCGYVGVPKSHPHYKKNYSDQVTYVRWRELQVGDQSPITLLCASIKLEEETDQVSLDLLYNVPGGLTYASDHAPYHSPDGYWYFGFDCSHYNDLSPHDVFADGASFRFRDVNDSRYRDFVYVQEACRRLAAQLTDFTSQYPEAL